MEDRINRQNLDADYRTRGKWAQIMDQFSNQENIKSVYKDFWDMRPNLPKNMKLSDFGSADGLFGSFFKKELEMQGYSVHLTIIDIIQEHLDQNRDDTITTIQKDLLDLNLKQVFDLGLMRSVLHYFDMKNQPIVLRNIYESIKEGGYFLSQNFVQKEEDLELYSELNQMIGKNFQLIDRHGLLKLLIDAGFKEIQEIDSDIWYHSHGDLKKRYGLGDVEIDLMRERVVERKSEKSLFRLLEKGFEVPVPYVTFLAKR